MIVGFIKVSLITCVEIVDYFGCGDAFDADLLGARQIYSFIVSNITGKLLSFNGALLCGYNKYITHAY